MLIEIGTSRWDINPNTLVGHCVAGEAMGESRQFKPSDFNGLRRHGEPVIRQMTDVIFSGDDEDDEILVWN